MRLCDLEESTGECVASPSCSPRRRRGSGRPGYELSRIEALRLRPRRIGPGVYVINHRDRRHIERWCQQDHERRPGVSSSPRPVRPAACR